jgi:hypothetical protein
MPKYDEAEVEIISDLVDAIYRILIPVEQQCLKIQRKNHNEILEIAKKAYDSFKEARTGARIKTTPGPWVIEPFTSPGQGEWHGWEIRGKHGNIVSVGAASQRGPIDMDSNQANTKLIAAAPDMYEFLCHLRSMSLLNTIWQPMIDILNKIEEQ